MRRILSAKSSKDLNAAGISREFPTDPFCYDLLEDCGRGVSATVHRAVCKPTNEVVAVKKMNLERVSMSLDEIIHEAQTMKSYHHPNVLPLYTSFVHGQDLWMVTPFMSGGSVLHIMKYKFPEGLDEVAIATIMRYVLLGLEYVHKNGGIHRDVKAGNILIDRDGTVRIGDFGVAATIERQGDWGSNRMERTTFVGTPCWMAPEVMEQANAYNHTADIWSFGITMLELANGHAPFAKFPPMKVLLMTLQNPPPQLDDKAGRRHFSKHMRNIIARCLQKDPAQRPSATELLGDKFFKQARDEEFLARTLLAELPALGERVQQIRVGKAATNAAENDKQLERSQEEYVKGVSSWNFDLAALKAQAAAQPDEGSTPQTPSSQPLLPAIAEGTEGLGEGDGSGASSRRSTEDAAAVPTGSGAGDRQQAPPARPAGVPLPKQQQQQQPQQPQQPQQGAAGAPQQLPPPHPQPAADAAGQGGAMRRASSAFAGSHAVAAAAAAAGAAGAAAAAGSTLQSHFSEPSSSLLASSSQGSQPPPQQLPPQLPPQPAGASSGGSSHCLSPLTGSPPMSRESSSQGPLSALATPDGLQLKGKSKGRFQVYEHGEQPPPMSPPANRGLQESLTGSFSRGAGAPAAAAAGAAGSDAGGGVAAAAAAALAGSGGGSGTLPRVSDSATGETPRAPRRVLGPAEAAELTAAAAAATAAAGTTGVGSGADSGAQGGTSTCSTPPPVAAAAAAAGAGAAAAAGAPGAALSLAGMAGSVSTDGTDGAAVAEPKKRGRFKIIEEEGPSRGSISKVPSSADLAATAAGGGARSASGSARGLPGGSAGSLLPELLRLHDQAAAHSAALARLIDGVRAGGSAGNLASVEDASLGGSGASSASAPLPLPRKPSAAPPLSRGGSSRALLAAGGELSRTSLAQLLAEHGGDASDVAERLLERGQELERQLAEVAAENQRLRARLGSSHGSSDSGGDACRGPEPARDGAGALAADGSRVASRRSSTANLAVPSILAGALPGTAGGPTLTGGGPHAASNGLPPERHSSSGASGGDSGGGAPLQAPAAAAAAAPAGPGGASAAAAVRGGADARQ